MAIVIKSVTPVNALVNLAFDSGSVEPTVGETVTGATSGDTAIVYSISLSSGAWSVGNAVGNLVLTSPTGYIADYSIFSDNELLNGSVSGSNFATANGAGTVETENLGETAVVYININFFKFPIVGETITGRISRHTGIVTEVHTSYLVLSNPTGYTASLEIFLSGEHLDGSVAGGSIGTVVEPGEVLRGTTVFNVIKYTESSNKKIVVKRKVGGGAWETIKTLPADSSVADRYYVDYNIHGSESYYYRLEYQSILSGSPVTSAIVYTPPMDVSNFAVDQALTTVYWDGKTATLAWENPAVYTSLIYGWMVNTDLTETWTDTTISGTLETVNVTLPNENTSYDFRIRAYDSATGLYSNWVMLADQTSGIMAPTELTATATSTPGQVDLTWIDNSIAEDGFQIYVDDVWNSNVAAHASTTNLLVQASVTGLTTATSYRFKVRAKNGINYSEFTQAVTVVTATPPDARPQIGAVTVNSDSSLTVTWTDTSTNATSYYVYRSEDDTEVLDDGGLESWSSSTVLRNWTKTLTGTSTIAREATEINVSGDGLYSAKFTVDSSNSLAKFTQSYTLIPGKTYSLKWMQKTAALGKFKFLLRDSTSTYCLGSDGEWDEAQNWVEVTGTTDWDDYVISFNPHIYIEEAGVTETPITDYILEIGATGASTINYIDDAQVIVYGSSETPAYEAVGSVLAGVGTYTDTLLTDNTKYTYKIKAYTTGGWSDPSSSCTGTTSLDLDSPTELTATVESSTQVTLSWTDNARSADYHSIERKSSTGTYSEVGTLSTAAATPDEYTDGSLSSGVEYTWRVRARYDWPSWLPVSGGYEYGEYSAPVLKTLQVVNSETVKWGQIYFAMGRYLCIASDEPINTITCDWISKPIDMDASGMLKTVDKVILEYEDKDIDVPISISISLDGGITFNQSILRTLGTGDNASKTADFWFEPMTAKNFVVKISTTSALKFSWTGLLLRFYIRSESFETE
jgi:hypothetical protein